MSDKKVITLICERAADLNGVCNERGECKEVDGVSVVSLPCSGMIQPLMIEEALKAGAAGVIVTGCQIGDCYYREGNKMIRDRLLGLRPPMLKKNVDRRRILALLLARPQTDRFISEAKEFVAFVRDLPADAPAAKPAAPAPAAAKPAAPASPAPAAPSEKNPEVVAGAPGNANPTEVKEAEAKQAEGEDKK